MGREMLTRLGRRVFPVSLLSRLWSYGDLFRPEMGMFLRVFLAAEVFVCHNQLRLDWPQGVAG